jgi:hypothetical protein
MGVMELSRLSNFFGRKTESYQPKGLCVRNGPPSLLVLVENGYEIDSGSE